MDPEQRAGCRAGRPAGSAGGAAPRGAAALAGGAGSWRLIGPVLPATLARDPVTVLGLASNGTAMTAILAAGTGPATSVLAAWSADGGTSWTLSPVLRTAAGVRPSGSVWSDGSAGLLLAGRRAVTIGWAGACCGAPAPGPPRG